jgi:hypothetical protein
VVSNCWPSDCLSDALSTTPQWLPGPTPTKRTEVRAAPSLVVPATTVAGWDHADQANRGQSIAPNCCARKHSGWLRECRTSDQRSEQRPHLSCPPSQWLSEPTPNMLSDVRVEPSAVVPATTVLFWAHADRANRGRSSSLNSRALHYNAVLSPCRPSEQRPGKSLTCRARHHSG